MDVGDLFNPTHLRSGLSQSILEQETLPVLLQSLRDRAQASPSPPLIPLRIAHRISWLPMPLLAVIGVALSLTLLGRGVVATIGVGLTVGIGLVIGQGYGYVREWLFPDSKPQATPQIGAKINLKPGKSVPAHGIVVEGSVRVLDDRGGISQIRAIPSRDSHNPSPFIRSHWQIISGSAEMVVMSQPHPPHPRSEQ